MDSLTQFALGAAVSTACLGKIIGPRKAVLVGGLLGTLPDLDVLLPFSDPVDSFVYHRGWSHSLFVHALVTPLIGEALVRGVKALRKARWLTYLTVFLCLSTHALIDAMTVYGTRLFWPFYPDPVGAGSIFIIDPVYTLPLLAVVIWAACSRQWGPQLARWTKAALVVSTCYMIASLGVQRHVEAKARAIFADHGGEPEQILAIAAPFNIAVWKIIGLDKDRYRNLYLSLLDGGTLPEIYEHPRHPELVACLAGTPGFEKLDWFSRGFHRADLVDQKVVVSDLRMGLTPAYAFRFAIGEMRDGAIVPISPERDLSERRASPEDLYWLADRFIGIPSVRAAELQQSQVSDQVASALGEGCSAEG